MKTTVAAIPALALVLLTLSSQAQTTTNIINNFDNSDEVTFNNGYPWGNWFGDAYQFVEWSTSDANNNPNSGSLKINAVFPGPGGGADPQFVVYNQNNGINPPLDGTTVTNFQCDVRYGANSASAGGNFGNLELGSRGTAFGQPVFGTVQIPNTQTNWVHISLPVNAGAQPAFATIPNVFVKTHSTALNGPVTLWVDNIKFVGPLVAPTMSVVKATPGLRIFAGSIGSIYHRAELATVDQNQSWIGGTYPVSYSFSLLSYPTSGNIAQTHIFLVPVNSTPNADPYGDNFVDFTANNGLWLTINPQAGGGVTATVSWKTHMPDASAFQGVIALRITNSTAVGTWTLTFTDDTGGNLSAPGAAPAPFTIKDPNVATDFANPLVAYFGLQPNSVAGEGEYEDWGSISVTGVAGVNENQNFLTSSSISKDWQDMSALAGSIVLVTSNTPVWVRWTVPDTGFGLGAKADLTDANVRWFSPAYYFNYDSSAPAAVRMGPSLKWILIPDSLPTLDGLPGGPTSSKAFFRLSNPPPAE